MTGIFANFNYNYGDDWESISPSTMWWLAGTPNSAFSNPKYRLTFDNRITKEKMAKKGTLQTLHALAGEPSEPFHNTDWTLDDERRVLKLVDPLTARMRRRLFKKMAREGVIERLAGQRAPTHGLAGAELDIVPFRGENPSPERVEQQMLFRAEWKKLNTVQRTQMLEGQIVSNNAVDMEKMCQQCIRGSAECKAKGITENPAVGIIWESEAVKDECYKACLPEVDPKTTNVVCKCWVDCSKGLKPEDCRANAHLNLVKERMVVLTPSQGEGSCITMDSPSAAVYKAGDYRPRMWDSSITGQNFAIFLWYKLKQGSRKTCGDKKNVVSLLYKGPQGSTPNEAKGVFLSLDCSSDPPKVVGKVAGTTVTSQKGLVADAFNFIMLRKKDTELSLWLGAGKEVAKDATAVIAGDVYTSTQDDAVYLVAPGTDNDHVPLGFVGKTSYIPLSVWEPEAKPIFDDKEPANCGV